MGTLRHSLQRRNHRERAQPIEREKWGLLEKPKDYRLRARDYQLKQRMLKRLREKAAEKNPDEFYFGMLREKTKDGIVRVDRGNPVLSEETVRLLKTQDAAYIKTMLRIEEEKVKKLEEDIHASFQTASNTIRKHYYFIDETGLESQKKDEKSQTITHTMQKKSMNEYITEEDITKTNFYKTDKHIPTEIPDKTEQVINSKQIHELESRKARIKQLSILAKQIDLERNLQTKGERRKVGISCDNIPIYQWKLERKR